MPPARKVQTFDGLDITWQEAPFRPQEQQATPIIQLGSGSDLIFRGEAGRNLLERHGLDQTHIKGVEGRRIGHDNTQE